MKPFSGTSYERNAARAGHLACAVCGKACKAEHKSAHVIGGGAAFARPGETDTTGGDMGWFPVGPDCAKRLAAQGAEIEDAS